MIKFRAWHKQFKLMKRVYKLDLDYDRVFVAIDSSKRQKTDVNRTAWNFNNIELMQWTYNYDKAKKEIYLGDIIRLGDKDTFYVSMFRGTHCLSWIQGNFIHNDRLLADFKASEIEVLGNRYENPELLEVSK